MLVTIRLFARLREIAGTGELRQELPAGATARTAWEALAARHPELGAYEAVASCAVNEEYAPLSTPLRDGDEVAFLPPVSGGALMPTQDCRLRTADSRLSTHDCRLTTDD